MTQIIINLADMLDERYIYEDFTTEVRTVGCLKFDYSDNCEKLLCSYLKSKLF